MDVETIGIISTIIDNAFEKSNILETINWVELDSQVRKSDFALGYIIGSLMNISDQIASDRKYVKKVVEKNLKDYENSMKKIYGVEEGKKEVRKFLVNADKIRKKGGRKLSSDLTDDEIYKIRNLLIPMIPKFRQKISLEEAFEKSKKSK